MFQHRPLSGDMPSTLLLLLLAFSGCGGDGGDTTATAGSAGAATTGGSGGGGGSGGTTGGQGGDGGAGGAPSTGGMAGSGGTGGAMTVPLSLAFIDDLNIATGTLFEGSELGGISGMWFDKQGGKLYAISDDRAEKGPARFYSMDVSLEGGALAVTPTAVIPFEGPNGPFAPKAVDPEGIAPAPGGGFFLSSEGDTTQMPRLDPAVFLVQADGSFVASLPVPEGFLPEPDGPQTKGVRNNLAFESLCLSPGGERLFTATEGALVQDDTVADFQKGTVTRILAYDLSGGAAAPAAEYLYPVDAVPDPGVPNVSFSVSGLVDLLPLDASRFLAMERAFVAAENFGKNTVKLYEVSIAGATDVAGVTGIPDNAVLAEKKLVLDLDTLVPELEAGFQSIDNFEAMTFGPDLPGGKRSLLVAADNNFSPTQRTVFLAFEVTGE